MPYQIASFQTGPSVCVGMEGSCRACSICLERSINTTFLPCQHETVCSFCASRLDTLTCPVCRTTVFFVLLKEQKVSDVDSFSSKWCLSCVVRYRQEVEQYFSRNVFGTLFTGFTDLKNLKAHVSNFVAENVSYPDTLYDGKTHLFFKPSAEVFRMVENNIVKPETCRIGCFEKAPLYDLYWGFSEACESKKAETHINGYPCRFDYCQLWELVRCLQSGDRLPQLLGLCFSSCSLASFQQAVDMHHLIYKYKENYVSVGLPFIVWIMLDHNAQNSQAVQSDVVSLEVIREELQKIVPYDRPNAVVRISFDSEAENKEFRSFFRIISELMEAHKKRTPRRSLTGYPSSDRGSGLKLFI